MITRDYTPLYGLTDTKFVSNLFRIVLVAETPVAVKISWDKRLPDEEPFNKASVRSRLARFALQSPRLTYLNFIFLLSPYRWR